ncbi:fibronectin type-III domain-containing protein 3A-like [Ornithorhynchus anatinus]|uniref:Fibronectin type-III domain-containing protein n=1 Tax=Ornithorhynchus anatinus TaxID=9258 RepID=F6S2F1_ORNAN|nr:fibronectin type-III domain-containing protein 3A-like [Ornithorhynchus anatinus]
MMADQPPPLEATPMLSEVPLLSAMVNGDSIQQVILVQVNPGETFTIRTEDGHIQCIQGPAHVPMMSPNGSMPPIFVPPGYVSQVVEENGVRKVVVLPHSADFHPSLHPPPPPPPPPPHVPHYMHPHPALLPHPPHPVYPPVPGAGELPPQFLHQHPPPPPPPPSHVYQEQESRGHGRTNFIQRDERTVKMQEHLKKRLKERQAGGPSGSQVNSPPSSPHKGPGPCAANAQNGCGKDPPTAGVPAKHKPAARTRGGPPAEVGVAEFDVDVQKSPDLLSISKPLVSSLRARSAVLSWVPTVRAPSGDGPAGRLPGALTFEVALSVSGKNGKFKSVYVGEEVTVTLPDLRPATDYHVRVSATCSSVKESASELVSFTTESCEPDPPAPPRLVSRTKNSLSLQWKTPNDNGSKVTNFLLEWDEGVPGTFKECYFGHLKQHKLSRLTPSTKYSFRLAAKNDFGQSGFGETALYYTAGSVPPPPAAPRVVRAGTTYLSLEWSRPGAVTADEALSYTLDVEEEGTGYGFQPRHNGEELSCTLKNLRRCTLYRLRVFAHNNEGKSGPSEVTECTTCPERPGPPARPTVRGKIHAHSVKVTWDPPRDDGGAEISKYVLEISESLTGSTWDTAYSGPCREHVCDRLRPGTWYRLRVSCVNVAGPSQVSDTSSVQTPAVPPGPCRPPGPAGRAKAREIGLLWAAPSEDGGSQVTEYVVDMAGGEQEERRQVYRGPEPDCTVSGLLPGRTYSFWLKAANVAGFGPFSGPEEIATAPGPPERCGVPLLACKAATCVLASWEVPACNGAEISDYKLEWGQTEGSMAVIYSGPCPSFEVKGLAPATTYLCRVQAANAAGAGSFGETGRVTTPASPPAAVTVLRVLEDGPAETPRPPPATTLALRWEEPSCHGEEITGYNIDYGERQAVAVTRGTSHVLDSLQPDTVYRIRVQAVNSLGPGPFGPTIRGKTRPLPPAPPPLECAAVGSQSLRLKWGDGPGRAPHPNPTQFTLQMEDRPGRFVTLHSGPCHTYKVQRLNEATAYRFKIQAYNGAGEGPFSDVYTFATARSPPSAPRAPRVRRLADGLCEVTWEPVAPMRGDPIVYLLQLVHGRGAEQVYKGPETSFRLCNFQPDPDHRVRVCAGRRYRDAAGPQELCGPYSPGAAFPCPKPAATGPEPEAAPGPGAGPARQTELSDEQFALILVVGFAAVAVLFAAVIQYFMIK